MARFSWPSLRRLLRFRLLTLLLVVTAICIVLGLAFQREPITAENLDRLRVISRSPQEVQEFHWSKSGGQMAYVGWETPVEIRDAITHVKLRTLGEGKKIIHFAFSPDPDVVAWAENCDDVELVRLSTGQITKLATGNAQPQPVFSPDGKWLVTGGYGTKAKIWDVATGKLAGELVTGTAEGGLTPVFSPDGSLIAVGNRNSVTSVFNFQTKTLVATFTKVMTQEIEFHPAGNLLAVAYVDGDVAIYEVSSGWQRAIHRTGLNEVYCVEWSPDGKLLAVGGSGGATIIYDDQLAELAKVPGPEWISDLRFSRDCKQLFRSGGEPFFGGKRRLEVLMVRPALLSFLPESEP